MDENEEKRNEIAATLFSVLAGLAVLLLAGWIMTANRGCSRDGGTVEGLTSSSTALTSGSGEADTTSSKGAIEGEIDADANLNVESNRKVDVSSKTTVETTTKTTTTKVTVDEQIDSAVEDALEEKELEIDQIEQRHLEDKADLTATNQKLTLAGEKREQEIETLQDQLDALKIKADSAEKLLGEKRELQLLVDNKEKRIQELTANLSKNGSDATNANNMITKLLDAEKLKTKNLTAQIAALNATSSDAQKKTANELKEQTSLVGKLKTEKKKHLARIKELESSLSTKDQTMSTEVAKLKKLQSEKLAALENVKRLTTDNTALNAEIKKLKGEAEKMSDSDTQLNQLKGENTKLKKEMASLTAAGGLAALTAKVTSLTKDKKKLNDEIAKLKKEMADAPEANGDEMAKLKQQNLQLADEIETLQAELITVKSADKLKAAVTVPNLNLPLLVNDPKNLDKSFVPLFVELREIADNPDAKNQVYETIRQRGKASPVTAVQFDSGSARVSEDKVNELKNLLNDDGAKYLVVGYASVEGNPQSNAELSSRRASQVAQEMVRNKDALKNNVQAVYFGQTSRFDKNLYPPNRVVEVWKITK